MSAVLLNIITQIAILGISLGTGVVSARALGIVGRGQLAAIILWPQVFAGLFAFGVPAALIYHARRTPEEERSLFFAALWLSIASSCVLLIAGSIAIPHALHAYGEETVRYAQLFLFVAPQVLISYVLAAHLQVHERFGAFNRFRLIPAAVTLVGLIAFAGAHALTAPVAAACYLLPSLPIFFIVLWRALALGSAGPPTAIRTAFRKILGYASRASGIDLLGTLSSQVDQLIVVSFLDAASMGAYVVALSISRVPGVIVSGMQQAIAPRAAGLEPVELTLLVGRCARVALAAMLLGGLALGAILPYILPHLFGHDFGRSVLITRILLIEVATTGASTLLAEAFKGVGRPGVVTVLQALSLGASIVLLFALVPRIGLPGAALALVGASLFRLCVLLAFYRRIVGERPPRLVIGTGDLRFLQGIARAGLAARAA